MCICDLYKQKKPVISFEVFPPKKESDIESIYHAVKEIASLNPDFMSVTYGAGGTSIGNKTLEIASFIQNEANIQALAHLTCITNKKQTIDDMLNDLNKYNIQNILALRGDSPVDSERTISSEYSYATDLIEQIKSKQEFCIGAACYPEVHIDCVSMEENLKHLKQKQDAGANFFISQLFFDNKTFYSFLEQAKKIGITVPISAGIMPMLSKSQIQRMIFMCGASLPAQVIRLLHKYEHKPEDLQKAGLEYAINQMLDLAKQGVDGIHIYAMNRPSIAKESISALKKQGVIG